jgi:hypothetical protein
MGGVERILSDARLHYKLSQDNGTSNGHLSAVMKRGQHAGSFDLFGNTSR